MDDRQSQGANSLAVNRRSFLKVTAGSMAALAAQGAYVRDVLGQNDPAVVGLQFFTDQQAATIEALAEQFWPTTEDSPGGRDAGVLYYIDNALAGAYQEYQEVYRVGLDWLDQASNDAHDANFRGLPEDQQREMIASILEDDGEAAPASATPADLEVEGIPLATATPVASEPDPEEAGGPVVAGIDPPVVSSLQEFMNIALTHTMEGLFSDPVYGGNRDFAGWRSVRYPGAHFVYTEEEQQSFEPLDKPLQSIADL